MNLAGNAPTAVVPGDTSTTYGVLGTNATDATARALWTLSISPCFGSGYKARDR